MVSCTKAVTDDHVCESSTPLQGEQNYSNSHVRGYGLLGKLSLIIRQLELDTYKTCQDKRECYGVLSHGEVERGTIVVLLFCRLGYMDSCALLTSSLVLVVQD